MIVDWCWILSKREKKPGDELFEEGDIYCHLATKQIPLVIQAENILERDIPDEIVCSLVGCNRTFESLSRYEAHYNSTHRNVCSQCKRVLPSNYLLDIHLQEWHDSMFELLAVKQPMYQCLLQTCDLKFSSVKERKNHMIKIHKYPSNFRFDSSKRQTKSKNTESSETNMEVGSTSDKTNVDQNGGNSSQKKRQYTYKVPDNICFGQGVARGFHRGRGRGRGRGKKGTHWHNKNASNMDTCVDIEKVDMMDLAQALDT